MASKVRFALFLIFTRALISVAYSLGSNEENLDLDLLSDDYLIVRKPQYSRYPSGFETDGRKLLEGFYQNEENMRPFIESENALSDEENDSEEENEIEDEETPYLKILPPLALPLRRTRRRIIPRVTGKTTMDTKRGGRNNPWNRSRSPWENPPPGSSVIKRTGPMGSEKLYALYPHLAPTGLMTKKSKAPAEDNTISMTKAPVREESSMEKVEPLTNKSERDVAVVKRKERRPKIRMTKEMKEEVAEYAIKNGVTDAVQNFQTRYNVAIRPGAVEKFVRRYEDRIQRKKSRENL